MHAEPDARDFDLFCHAVRAWLRNAPSLDPSLAAAADVLTASSDLDCLAMELQTAADTHRTLGASALLALWEAKRGGRLAAR